MNSPCVASFDTCQSVSSSTSNWKSPTSISSVEATLLYLAPFVRCFLRNPKTPPTLLPCEVRGGSGSLGSAATDIMADAFVSADGVLQEHLHVSRGKYDEECHREFLTPSPTGPLDASPFFDEPFSAAEEAR